MRYYFIYPRTRDSQRHSQILNKINTLLPVTPVDIRTVKGVLTVTQLPRHIPRNMVYPSIPDSLAYIPVVPLSDLRMCLVSTLHPNIDIVTRTGDITESWYAFKRYAIPLEKQDLSMDVLLSDVEHLSRLDSPYIMKPSFVVTDTSDPSLFRGYLTPFMPAGTLEDVFEELLVKGITACTTQILSDITSVKPFEVDIFEERERRTAATMKQATSPPNLAWSLKHTWAIEGARALATLHNSAIYSGDVKLNNILLDRNGHLRFIDVAPQEGYTDPYLAPEFHALACDVDLPLTEARDIYAFGIVLWQIAEEVGRIDVEDPSKAIDLVWRSDSISGSTPHWFRDLATRCVDSDPTKRPSAKFVMDVLEYNQSMWGTFTRLISDISHWVQGYWYGI